MSDNRRSTHLQVASQTLLLQSRPNDKLRHPRRMPRPRHKVRRIRREIRLLLPNGRLVIQEEDGPPRGAETGDATFGAVFVDVGWEDGFEGFVGDVPEFVVFFVEEGDGSGGLIVAGNTNKKQSAHGIVKTSKGACHSQTRWGVLQSMLDDILNPGIRDGRFLAQSIDRSTLSDGVKEGGGSTRTLLGRHWELFGG